MLRHSPAASRAMGILMLLFGIPCLWMAYALRKAGFLGTMLLFGGAYIVVHGVVLCIATDRRLPTLKEGLIIAVTIVALGGYVWFVASDSSIWG